MCFGRLMHFVQIHPSDYTLRHDLNDAYYIRSWTLSGSNDGTTWVVIDRRENDSSIDAPGSSCTFHIEMPPDVPHGGFFRYFRVTQTSPNSSGDLDLMLSGFEIYGSIIKRPVRSPAATLRADMKPEGTKVYVWGDNENGKLGLGDGDNNIKKSPELVPSLDGKGICEFGGGTEHSICLSITGEVYTWGKGDGGRLGHGDELRRDVPTVLASLTHFRIMHVSAGPSSSACVSETGVLFTWGAGDFGKLGHGDTVTVLSPKRVQFLEAVK